VLRWHLGLAELTPAATRDPAPVASPAAQAEPVPHVAASVRTATPHPG